MNIMRLNHSSIVLNLAYLALSVTFQPAFGGESKAVEGNGSRDNPYMVPVTAQTISVDGVLDEEAWKGALVLELKYEVEPGENIEPPVRTECLVIYNKTRLYIAFSCHDPDPGLIRPDSPPTACSRSIRRRLYANIVSADLFLTSWRVFCASSSSRLSISPSW